MEDDDTRQQIERRVDRVQRGYEGHGRIFRILWVVVGVTIVLAGLAMTVIPGPAIIVIPVGLAMLAAEFAWARKLLTISITGGLGAKSLLDNTSARTKLLGGALACLAAAVAAPIILQ